MVTPRKSPVDPHTYRYITLPNGFKALLISTCNYEEEPPEKKRAYTKKDKRCELKKTPSAEERAKLFNQKNLLLTTGGITTSALSLVSNNGASLLQNVALLSETKLNPLFTDPDDVPVEQFEEEIFEGFPELNERQQRACCMETKEFDMMACMALTVCTGYFDDPPNLMGAAHLLEHIFLMGCQKYPKSTHFDEFLEFTGGGPWNGNTDGCRTVYYFDTSADYIAEVLDILAEHIKKPKLSRHCIVRERDTIDAEWRKAIPVEIFRFNQFLQSLSTPGHPYHTFSWGSAKTLGRNKCDANVRSLVVQFYRDHYAADSMFFAIQAPETLKSLETLVSEAFGCLPAKKKACHVQLTQLPMPFCNKRFTKLYKVAALSNTRKLMVTWQLPAVAWKEYDVKPLNYIAYVLVNENRGGLVHYLVDKGLIRDLSVNPTESNMERSDACTIFSLHFTLTKAGLENYLEVLRALFSYIQLMVTEGPQYRIFVELAKISAMQFHYLREPDMGLWVKELSEAMRVYKPEDVISGPVLIRKYDSDLIARLTKMLRPEEANFILFSKDFTRQCNRIEPYFGVQYKETNFDAREMCTLRKVKVYDSFSFCEPNRFITTDFSLSKPDCREDVETLFPIKLCDPQYPADKQPAEIWYYEDEDLIIPQASYLITLNSPVAMESALNAVMLDIYAVLLRDHFRGPTFSATMAQLQVDIQTTQRGLRLSLAGFSQKLPLLLKQLLSTLTFNDTRESRFHDARHVIVEDYVNLLLEPCLLSADLRKSILYENYWSIRLRYSIATDPGVCTFEKFRRFLQKFMSRLHVRAYLGGNINRSKAKEIMALFPAYLKYEPVPLRRFPKNRAHLLPLGEKCLRVRSFSIEGDTTVVKNVYQIGAADWKSKIIADYILEVIAEPLFHVLRTEKGLSYNPDIIIHEEFGMLTLQIHLPCRAERHEPQLINKEVDKFLEKFYDIHISTLTEAKIEKLRKEVISSKLMHLTSPGDFEALWEQVTETDLDFKFLVYEIEQWKTLKAKDIKDFFKRFLLRPSYVARLYPGFLCKSNGVEYRKITIQVVGYTSKQRKRAQCSRKPLTNYSTVEHLQAGNEECHDSNYFITDIEKFKKSLLSFPPQF